MSVPMLLDAETSRSANIAYHLIPEPVWESQKHSATYEPEAYKNDGFIHLTLGLDPLVNVANMFYTEDARQYRILVIDLNSVDADVKYEDPERVYPHIYGLLNTDAVIGELAVSRGPNGVFLAVYSD